MSHADDFKLMQMTSRDGQAYPFLEEIEIDVNDNNTFYFDNCFTCNLFYLHK